MSNLWTEGQAPKHKFQDYIYHAYQDSIEAIAISRQNCSIKVLFKAGSSMEAQISCKGFKMYILKMS